MTWRSLVTPPSPVSPQRADLRTGMTHPQGHYILHGFPLAAMPARRPGPDPDVRPDTARGRLVGVLPHPFCNPTVAGRGFCTLAHEPYHGGRAAAVVDHVARGVRSRPGRTSGFGRRVDALYFGGGAAYFRPAEPFRRSCRVLAGSLDLRDAEVTREGVPAYFVKRRPLLMDVLGESPRPGTSASAWAPRRPTRTAAGLRQRHCVPGHARRRGDLPLCLVGDPFWSVRVGEPIHSQPAVAQGRPFQTQGGNLFCLETGDPHDDGRLMWGAGPDHNGLPE